jgi:NAD-dependent deacetylase
LEIVNTGPTGDGRGRGQVRASIVRLQELFDGARRAVFFGGAGTSTESGIPDFRSDQGIFLQDYPYPPEQIVARSFFDAHPEEFFAFYRAKLLYPQARPNPAHRTLAALEAAGRLAAMVTQNIDGLHQLAGSREVIELHGSVHRNTCLTCGAGFDLDAVAAGTGVPRCRCGGILKPDVVLYEEPLDDAVVARAITAISAADLLIIGGTSLAVYPAAGLLGYFRGPNVVVINTSPTRQDRAASLVLSDPIGEVLAQIKV